MPTKAAAHRHVSEFGFPEDEGVKNLGITAMKPARRLGEPIGRYRRSVGNSAAGEAGVVIRFVVNRVVPTSCTNSSTYVAAVNNVQFRENIEPVGHQPLVEVVLSVVEVRVVGGDYLRLAIMRAKCSAVLDRVVPANLKVRAVLAEFRSM